MVQCRGTSMTPPAPTLTSLALQLVKVICKAPTFMAAVQKMQRALYEFHIRGIKVNSHVACVLCKLSGALASLACAGACHYRCSSLPSCCFICARLRIC